MTGSLTTGGDVRTVRTLSPRSVAEASALLSDSAGTVLFRGAGSKLDWAGRVPHPDLVLDTTQMTGVLTHNPADLTASVRAGTSLAALQEHLAEHGQWLALDPASASLGATVGGLLATGDSGPARLRYGALRDLVIGTTLVLADGTVARSGGHVIKNVAGYDLAKLAYGSLGSLGLVAEVVVRLHPLPAATATLSGPADAAQATAAALALAASPLEPAAVEWIGGEGPGRLHVRLDGTASSVPVSARRLTELLTGLGVRLTELDGAQAQQAWEDHARAALGTDDETVLRVAGLPSDLAALAADASAAAQPGGLAVSIVSGAALGLHTVRLRGGRAQDHAQAFTQLRERARLRGADVLLRRRSDEVEALVDALGPPPPTVALLRAVKQQFDPARRCAPGRFSPWY